MKIVTVVTIQSTKLFFCICRMDRSSTEVRDSRIENLDGLMFS